MRAGERVSVPAIDVTIDENDGNGAVNPE